MSDTVQLARPDFILTNADGKILELYCKVCGVVTGTEVAGRFQRLRNHAEIKMRFEDGSNHVTSICHDCVSKAYASSELMQALHDADMYYMSFAADVRDLYLGRTAPQCVAVELKRQGIK